MDQEIVIEGRESRSGFPSARMLKHRSPTRYGLRDDLLYSEENVQKMVNLMDGVELLS